jgi:hypothetical protein
MMYPDEQVEGEFKPTTIGQSLSGGFIARLEVAAQISRFTESPIETMLGLALAERLNESGIDWAFVPPDGWEYGDKHWCLIPQQPWRRYRVDWAIRRIGKQLIFIECDGNEFHTKPEDVARDRARDAEMTAAGIKVIRFTGSEIFNDAAGCAARIYQEAIS